MGSTIVRHTIKCRNGAAVCSALIASPALAGGFNLDHQNAAAMGAAFAGVQAEKSDSGYAAYNPAAIAGVMSAEISASVTGVLPAVTYSNADATLLGFAPVSGAASGEGVISNAVVPNISIAVPVAEHLTLGLLANATFGFKTDYAPDSVVRYQAQESDLKILEVTPMAAYEVSPFLRLGAGLRIQRMDLSLTSTIDAGGIAAASLIPGFLPGSSDLHAAFDVKDIAIGYVVGAQADLAPSVHAGFSYSSKVDHALDGDAQFDLASSPAAQILNGAAGLFSADRFASDFATPASAALGLRYEATDHLALLASARVMFWSSFDAVTLTFDDGATPAETLTQNWKDSLFLSAGAEMSISKETTLRAGFMFDESPVNGAFASPRIPDGDRYWIAAGLSRDLGEKLSIDVSAAYAFFSARPINIDGAAAEDLFRGALTTRVETEVFAASMRLRYKF